MTIWSWLKQAAARLRAFLAPDALDRDFDEELASHLAMLTAIAGHAHIERAYRAAIEGRFMWHEFGDLHLILPDR